MKGRKRPGSTGVNAGAKPLWAPWRMEYILGAKEGGCFLCIGGKRSRDRERHVIHRGKSCFVIANAYPYANGHLMVAPLRHVSGLEELTATEAAELMRLTQRSVAALKRWSRPQGFNIGFNIGKAAGAGETHIHQHVVPRWEGDTNFMPVLAATKVIPEHLRATCAALRRHF